VNVQFLMGKHLLYIILAGLGCLCLSGCGKGEIQAENTQLKDEVGQLKSDIAVMKSEAERRGGEMMAFQDEIKKSQQKIHDLETAKTEAEQSSRTKERIIRDECFENIELLLKSLIDQSINANTKMTDVSIEKRNASKESIKDVIKTSKSVLESDILTLKNNGTSDENILKLKNAAEDFLQKVDSVIDAISLFIDYTMAGDTSSAESGMHGLNEKMAALKQDQQTIMDLREEIVK